MRYRTPITILILVALFAVGNPSALAQTWQGQAQPAPASGPTGYGSVGYGTTGTVPAQPNTMMPTQTTSTTSSRRSAAEMVALYGVGTAYGVGMGVATSTEIGIEDPGIFLIPPVLLGVAAPIGVYVLDRPSMPEGMPTAITAGLLLGAGEGIGIVGTQYVRAKKDNEWGWRALNRGTAIGATAGGVAGWAVGYYLEPPVNTSLLAMSGSIWGMTVGSMFAYGATSGNSSYGQANDTAAIGGLVGYNVGMLAAASYGILDIPSTSQIGWMWAGGGLGAAASLPVFLVYAGEGGPPARRGFIFMGTATTLGIVAAGVFASDSVSIGATKTTQRWASSGPGRPSFARVLGVVPTLQEKNLGLSVFGVLE